MIDWSAIRPVLVQVFTDIAVDQGVPTFSSEWADRHRDYIHPGQEQAIYLKVTSCVGIGEDEDRYDRADDGEVYVTQSGLRRFVLNVQSEVAEDEDSKWALQTLERIRTRLRRRSVLDALLAVEVALIEVGTTQNVSSGFDRRVRSIGNLDVTFCAAVNDTDPIPTGWIERVVLSSQVRDAAGNVLPPPSNFTNETIPSE